MINILSFNTDAIIKLSDIEYADNRMNHLFIPWNRLNPQEPLLRESLFNSQGFWLSK